MLLIAKIFMWINLVVYFITILVEDSGNHPVIKRTIILFFMIMSGLVLWVLYNG